MYVNIIIIIVRKQRMSIEEILKAAGIEYVNIAKTMTDALESGLKPKVTWQYHVDLYEANNKQKSLEYVINEVKKCANNIPLIQFGIFNRVIYFNVQGWIEPTQDVWEKRLTSLS